MKAIRGAVNAFVIVAVVAIVALLAITVADVLGRMIFARPIVGATEICEILMAVMLTAIGGSLLAKKVVQVDVLMDAIPKKASIIVDTIVISISAVYCFAVGWATFLNSRYELNTKRVYTFLNIPRWPFLLLLALSFVIAGLATICFIVVLHQDKTEEKSVLDHADLAILEEVEKNER